MTLRTALHNDPLQRNRDESMTTLGATIGMTVSDDRAPAPPSQRIATDPPHVPLRTLHRDAQLRPASTLRNRSAMTLRRHHQLSIADAIDHRSIVASAIARMLVEPSQTNTA